MIKVISVAAMIAGLSTSAFAGAKGEPIIENEPENVFVAPSSSSAGLALPLAIGAGVVAIGLIASNNDNDSTTTTPVVD